MSRINRPQTIFFLLIAVLVRWTQHGNKNFFLPGEGGIFSNTNSSEYSDGDLMGELWVSPYGTEKEVLNRLAQTKYDLDIWLYRITYREVEQILKNLASMGVDIRRIAEEYPYEGRDTQYLKLKNRLEPYGIQAKGDEELDVNFNHAKLLIADDERFLISTANLTYTSLWKNREYRFAGTHSGVVASIDTIFQKDWNGEDILHDDVHKNLLVCPIDCREKLTRLIDNAQESIWIQAQYVQDDEVIYALQEKSKEGVEVRILLGKWQDAGWVDEFDGGVVRLVQDPYIHAKTMLVDDETFVIGSMNFSQNALDNNREFGIITGDEGVVKTFRRQFEKDWDLGIDERNWEYEN